MDTFIRLIEAEVHNALRGARIIGMIHVEHDTKDDGYVEDAYIVAWERDGAHSNFGTHRAAVNNQGDTMLVWGHYDIPSKEDTLKDMLERASVKEGKVHATDEQYQAICDVIDAAKNDDRSEDTDVYASGILEALGLALESA